MILAAELISGPLAEGQRISPQVSSETALDLGSIAVGHEGRAGLQLVNRGQDLLHYHMVLQDQLPREPDAGDNFFALLHSI